MRSSKAAKPLSDPTCGHQVSRALLLDLIRSVGRSASCRLAAGSRIAARSGPRVLKRAKSLPHLVELAQGGVELGGFLRSFGILPRRALGAAAKIQDAQDGQDRESDEGRCQAEKSERVATTLAWNAFGCRTGPAAARPDGDSPLPGAAQLPAAKVATAPDQCTAGGTSIKLDNETMLPEMREPLSSSEAGRNRISCGPSDDAHAAFLPPTRAMG